MHSFLLSSPTQLWSRNLLAVMVSTQLLHLYSLCLLSVRVSAWLKVFVFCGYVCVQLSFHLSNSEPTKCSRRAADLVSAFAFFRLLRNTFNLWLDSWKMECVFVQQKDWRLTTCVEKLTLQGQSEKELDYCDKELVQPTERRSSEREGDTLTHLSYTAQ